MSKKVDLYTLVDGFTQAMAEEFLLEQLAIIDSDIAEVVSSSYTKKTFLEKQKEVGAYRCGPIGIFEQRKKFSIHHILKYFFMIKTKKVSPDQLSNQFRFVMLELWIYRNKEFVKEVNKFKKDNCVSV